MKCNFHLSFLFISIFLFASCQDYEDAKPPSSSREGEVLVLMPDKLWESAAGDSLKNFLLQPVEGLGQYEALFRVAQIEKKEFSNTLKIYRNVIVIHLNDNSHTDNALTVQFDKWAKPQITLNLYAYDETELITNIVRYGNSITAYLNKEELKRKTSSYKNLADKKIQSNLNDKFNLNVAIPRGYKWSLDDDNFVWIRNETMRTSQSIWIHKQKFEAEDLTPKKIIENRNVVVKKYIPGDAEGSYMKTAGSEFLTFDRVKLNDIEVVRTKGLWDLEGDFMGGPFINYSFVLNENLITIEGFVYAPGKPKHSLIKQLNAIINSLEIIP